MLDRPDQSANQVGLVFIGRRLAKYVYRLVNVFFLNKLVEKLVRSRAAEWKSISALRCSAISDLQGHFHLDVETVILVNLIFNDKHVQVHFNINLTENDFFVHKSSVIFSTLAFHEPSKRH